MEAAQPLEIEITTQPSAEDLRVISEGIQDFNRKAVPGFPEVSEELRFAVFARNATGAVVGGIRAACFWGSLNIELLWMSEQVRGRGAGSQLLEAAEMFARERGLRHARVETTSFQARPFYEKHGYKVYGKLEDFPLGHVSWFLSKRL